MTAKVLLVLNANPLALPKFIDNCYKTIEEAEQRKVIEKISPTAWIVDRKEWLLISNMIATAAELKIDTYAIDADSESIIKAV